MIDLVVSKLKTGTYKNVIPFGYPIPSPIYLVVKEEPTNLGYTRWRIIGHALPNQLMLLRTYMRKDVRSLMLGPIAGTGLDLRYMVIEELPGETMGSLSVISDDGTISLEAIFRQSIAL
jgi:hypothetical protein